MPTQFKNVKGTMIGVRLPDNVIALLKKRIEKSGLTMSEYVRSIIEHEVVRSHHKR